MAGFSVRSNGGKIGSMYSSMVVACLAWRHWKFDASLIRVMGYVGNIRRSEVLKSRSSKGPHLRTQWIGGSGSGSGTDAFLSLQFCLSYKERQTSNSFWIPFCFVINDSLSPKMWFSFIFTWWDMFPQNIKFNSTIPSLLFPSFFPHQTHAPRFVFLVAQFSSLFLLLL